MFNYLSQQALRIPLFQFLISEIKAGAWTRSWFLIVFVQFFIAGGTVFYFLKTGVPLRLSDSISFDKKLEFLRHHHQHLSRSDLLVAGSSMALNNINSAELEKSPLFSSVINTGSWGLGTHEVLEFIRQLDVRNVRHVLYSAQYFDFGPTRNKNIDFGEINGYLYRNALVFPVIRTIQALPSGYRKYLDWEAIYQDKSKYTCLVFNRYGDVGLDIPRNRINPARWGRVITKTLPAKLDYSALLQLNAYLAQKKIKLIVVRPPFRKKLLRSHKKLARIFTDFGKKLTGLAASQGFIFMDMHRKLDLDDHYFVDKSHLTPEGARLMSATLVHWLANRP